MHYPVILFCYNRLDVLKLTIEHLRKNHQAALTDLFVYSDAASGTAEQEKVREVRQYIKTIDGFKEVHIRESKANKGLAKSIIEGVSEVLKVHEAVIVLEDDLLTSTNFLCFMNQSLEYYYNNKMVYSVSGYTVPITFPEYETYDNYFTRRASSWGWATWRNRWLSVDWIIADYQNFTEDSSARRKFNKMGSDLAGMLDKQMTGKINSWAIRWCYHQFKTNCYTVFPNESKVQNVGFNAAATHTSAIQFTRFATRLDDSGKQWFKLNPFVRLDPVIIRQFTKTYSIATRLKYKLLGFGPLQAILRIQRS